MRSSEGKTSHLPVLPASSGIVIVASQVTVERKSGKMFHIHHALSGRSEIRFDFEGSSPEQIPPFERRSFIRLSSSVDVVNAWLSALATDSRYAVGTAHEYAKALLYALEWLSQEPVNSVTRESIGHSLLTLSRSDLRSLFSWLAIPANMKAERAHLAKTGDLPAGYRKNTLSPSTHNLRHAALTSFYDWIIFEYNPPPGITFELTENPLRDNKRPSSNFPIVQRGGGFLPGSLHQNPQPSSPFRRRQNDTGPVALSPCELQYILGAIPHVSHGHNAANRNGALIRLLLWGMLRQEELVGASWEAVDGETLWVVGKGSKRRMVPIADASTWSYLQAYTNELQIPYERRFHGPLLRQLDHDDRPISRHTVEHLICSLRKHFRTRAALARDGTDGESQSLEKLAGKLHSHIFRATGATFMAKAGMNLIMLSLLLGHSDPSTTMRYYIAAEQLSLAEEVQRICERVASVLDLSPSSTSDHNLPDPRSWYKRRGLIPS